MRDSQAMSLYKRFRAKEMTLQDVKSVCTCTAEDFEADSGKGYKFGDGSVLIITSDNLQVSLL